ncbi:4Fe-4S dicluster domain-containing protein [Megasphaera cerevisiae]|uniref:4Fe-4S dicluster domain-containing protein n=1 Tax=Megasphaera cerevisiae TaxID=39029 RepID=UPI00099A126E|nr:4Fe-4S dicluster domain-containing protein [Megasphaera cerevisiae]SJZ67755.1 Fe-S-cluster-containing hydrogenase components 2 [Megasphaera cerevisiae DSM 20462]
MNKFIKADPILCIGCRTCMIACVVNHTGKRIFEIDPNSYDFNPRIHIVKNKNVTKPVQCHHCPKPKCLEACPFDVISLGKDSVILDEDRCTGCGFCAKACPFGAITMAEIYHPNKRVRAAAIPAPDIAAAIAIETTPAAPQEKGFFHNLSSLFGGGGKKGHKKASDVPEGTARPQPPVPSGKFSVRTIAYKCDLCAHTDTGQPACIPACPTEALSLVDPAVIAAQRAKLQAEKKAREGQSAQVKL